MEKDTQSGVLKVILHAPTPTSLERARNNAANLLREDPAARIRLVANAQAVAAALDMPHPEADALTWLCPITLARSQRENRPPLQVLEHAAVLELARLQQQGWIYIRS